MEDLVIVAIGAAAFMAYLVFRPGPRAPNVSPRTDSIEVTHIDPQVDAELDSIKYDIVTYLPVNVQEEWLGKVAELEQNQRDSPRSLSLDKLKQGHKLWRNKWVSLKYFPGGPPWVKMF